MRLRIVTFLLLLLVPGSPAFPSVALLLEEPFGTFGRFNPTGHAAIYLSHVCAASPTELRPCEPGELGVVISRYHHVDGYDWLAIPLVPYLYAVDDPRDIPATADRKTEASLRDRWRRAHLERIAPDARDSSTPKGEWTELVGALYDRKIFAFEVDTDSEQDEALIAMLNGQKNRSSFNLFFHNCADFSRRILDFYYPDSVRRSYTADLGMTTPKHLAKTLVRYTARHERLGTEVFVLPQVPGEIPRSTRVDGVIEAFLRKEYVVPVAIFQPYLGAAFVATYLTRGRFDPAKNAVVLEESNVLESLLANHRPGPAPPPPGMPLRAPVAIKVGEAACGGASGFTSVGYSATDPVPAFLQEKPYFAKLACTD